MPWQPITKENLYDAKVGALIDACDTAALANGQANRSAGLIQGVVDHIRRKVASCQRNRLDVDTTFIPSGLKDLAVTLIIAKLKTALELDLTEDERANVATAERNLNRVAECKDVVEQPVNPLPSYEEMQVSYGTTSQSAPRKASIHKLGGLI